MYEAQSARMDAHLEKSIEANIARKGRKASPEMVLHHIATIVAVAKVKNGGGSPFDVLGEAETMDMVDQNYPLELSLVRNAIRFMQNPGNESEIDSMLNTVQGIKAGGMTTAEAMQQMKNRLGKTSWSMSH